MNIYKNILIIFCLLFTLQEFDVNAQKANKKVKTTKMTITSQVVDESDRPISGARVHSSHSRMYTDTNKNGYFKVNTNADDILVVKADGYQSQIIPLSDEMLKKGKIILKADKLFEGEYHMISVPFGTTTARRTVGAFSSVSGEKLEETPSLSLPDALGGRINGLFQLQNTLVPGWTNHTMFVRGAYGDYITIVDGVERTLDYLEPEVIESVEILKDATLKALYGGLQANGILFITTKKGKAYENSVRINVEQGIQTPTRLPDFLNAYEYATYYNQALANDGLQPLYDQKALDAYKNHTDPIFYPDVDYYKEFLNKTFPITRANTQISGGNRNVRYFAHMGYQGHGGLEKYTKYPNSDNTMTARASIELDVLDFIKANAGFNTAYETREWPNISTQNFFAPLAAYHPNDIPILIPGSVVGRSESEYLLGGNAEKQNNPYGLLTRRGNAERRFSYIQSDLGVTFDLNQWIKGLKIVPFVTFDVYNAETASQGATFAVYEPKKDSETENITVVKWGEDTRSTSQSRTDANVERNYAFNLTATYQRTFGKNDFKGILNYYQSRHEIRNVNEVPRRQNLGLHLSDMIKNKYIVELDVNRVGVTSFSKTNRYGIFPAFGGGWILSEEDFFKGIKFVDYLKLKASYGILGSTTTTPEGAFTTHIYDDVWKVNGTINLDDENYLVSLERTGNPNAKFQKSYEFNAGIDALLFDKSTRLSLGYFNNVNDGMLVTREDIIPGIIGLNEALPYWNYNKFGLKGFEGELEYSRFFGNLKFCFSANMTYGISKRIIDAEPPFPIATFEGLIMEGRPVDAIMGYKVIGTFQNQDDIDYSPQQTFGLVRPGDLKYADTNRDNVIDERDREEIGNSSPRLQYGLTFDFDYKGFNLNLLIIGYGKYERLLDTQYYQIYGKRKYSRVVIDGLPNGNSHPKLSAFALNNNFVSSDYWIVDGSFIKLRNAELGYTLPHQLTGKININKVKFFVRGHNLLTFSKIKDLDPENLTAAIGNFPLCTTYSLGVSMSF